MITVAIWLAWVGIGWLANVVELKPGNHRLIIRGLSAVCVTVAAILATIGVN